MNRRFSLQQLFGWIVLSTSLFVGSAYAAQEPTMDQIYATAKAGNLDQAQVMVQQVLVAHPNSAKAHFIQSELFARQGNLTQAREALATAKGLAPGLPFAKVEAVQTLENQLARPATASSNLVTAHQTPTPEKSAGWLLPALLAVGVIAAGFFFFRRKAPQPYEQQAAYGGGLNGPQTFGNAAMQPAYGGQPGYGPGAYGQPAGSGLGGRIMGGVATGLAVGAGVMAAEAIGRNLMGNHDNTGHAVDNTSNTFEPLSGNADLGGQDFGINDTSWDDAGAGGGGGGSDWDN
jgi:hypothetical protein